MELKSLLIDSLGLGSSELDGKVAVVTGAGRGIGREVARAFALLGACVVIAELSEQGRQVEAEIRQDRGRALYVRTDVSRAKDVHRLADAVHAEFGAVDILINNAMRSPVASVMEMDEAAWDEVMAVNLRGTFLTCKAFLPDMVSRGSGTIINMVSTEAMPGLAAYIASKQGIAGFSQSLALEVGPAGVRVIPFGPGMVDTPGIRGVADGLAPRLGLSREQFLGLSLHAAYDGLMPVEHAAAATVYLALRLADEYQGQAVNGYEVLERAGLLKPTPVSENSEKTDRPGSDHPTRTALSKDWHAETSRLSAEVLEIIQETGREFDKLPAFVRPLARSGFKSKAGAGLGDWPRILAGVDAQVEAGKGGELAARLEKLIHYYEGVPGETARFTRDTELLRQVGELSNRRIERIRALIAALSSAQEAR